MKINKQPLEDLYWAEDEIEYLPQIKNMPSERRTHLKTGSIRRSKAEKHQKIQEQVDDLREYDFTYKASRHESWWLLDSLGPFYDEQWLDDVLRMVQPARQLAPLSRLAAPGSWRSRPARRDRTILRRVFLRDQP